MVTQTFSAPAPNIPAGTPYADLTTPDTVVVISQPRDQVCAVLGGIMAARMAKLGAKGIVVDGRVRDMGEMYFDTGTLMRQLGIVSESVGSK